MLLSRTILSTPKPNLLPRHSKPRHVLAGIFLGGQFQPPLSYIGSLRSWCTITTAANSLQADNTDNSDLSGLLSPFTPDTGYSPLTREELTAILAAGAVKDKRLWTRKILDIEICNKWLEEAAASPGLSWIEEVADPDINGVNEYGEWDDSTPAHEERRGLTTDRLETILTNLRLWAAANTSAVMAGPVPGTYIADDYVPSTLCRDLLDCVHALEETTVKDWHPGSDEQVLDLVHPSLFCLVHGVSRRVKARRPFTIEQSLSGDAALGEVVLPPVIRNSQSHTRVRWPHTPDDDSSMASKRFQWLPAEFAVGIDGSVTIQSYINNLHPHKHSRLYTVLAQLFQLFVPLLNNVLTDLRSGNSFPSSYANWLLSNASPDSMPRPDQHVELSGRQLQVIVKLANIQLAPERPCYPGGAWHLEGMANEHIIASVIYYYDQDNISSTCLAFRFALDQGDMDYEQDSHRQVRNRYGLEDGGPLNQALGQVSALDGRCLAFPNAFQHRVQPFQLADPARPGHRKILVFFLVDPSRRIMSTADIPPQRLDWRLEQALGGISFTDLADLADPKHPALRGLGPEIREALVRQLRSRRDISQGLPQEAVGAIIQQLDEAAEPLDRGPPFSMARARAYREELMAERKFCIDEQNGEIFERPFSLCEH